MTHQATAPVLPLMRQHIVLLQAMLQQDRFAACIELIAAPFVVTADFAAKLAIACPATLAPALAAVTATLPAPIAAVAAPTTSTASRPDSTPAVTEPSQPPSL